MFGLQSFCHVCTCVCNIYFHHFTAALIYNLCSYLAMVMATGITTDSTALDDDPEKPHQAVN